MSETQQIFFFVLIMVCQWVVPLLVSFVATFFGPAYDGANTKGITHGWIHNVCVMRKISLFTAGVAYSGLIATMFESSFVLASVIGICGGLYNLTSNSIIEKNIGPQ